MNGIRDPMPNNPSGVQVSAQRVVVQRVYVQVSAHVLSLCTNLHARGVDLFFFQISISTLKIIKTI